MERHLLRALLSIGLLVILAWTGIALFTKLHLGGEMAALIVIWAICAVAIVGFVISTLMQMRRERGQRGQRISQ